jgi:hypothetical protein
LNHPLRLEYVDPATLLSGANPRNWRTHSVEQCAAFEGLLAECGWTDAALYNELTEHMLDGHMRAKQALANRLPVMPVLIGAWDAATEAKILASRDTLGLMAGIDPKAWTDLLRDVDTGCTELMALFSDLSEEWGVIPSDDDPSDASEPDSSEAEDLDVAGVEAEEPEASDEGAVDLVFPSDNEWGVPKLDPRMQASGPVFPMTLWGSVGRRKAMPGTWLFYTADRRFDSIWKDPGAILYSGPSCAVEPNYSTHPQMPRAFVLWGIYRKRWVNRWWQSKGVRTFVDLNVGQEVRDLNFLGVPREWRAFATRSHSEGSAIASEFESAANHAGTDELTFLVYGGGSVVKEMCETRGWFWCPEESDVVRGKVPR